ncbi:MAG: hypothetical protein AAB225_02500 [Acidobacteriota bacterium]
MQQIVLVVSFLSALPWAAAGEQAVFRAGAATSNITPPLGSPIVGGWEPYPATYVHDELHARCLVLDDSRTRLAIAVSDNVGIAREVYDEAKRAINQKTGLPLAHMLMSSTHTHSAASARGSGAMVSREPLDDYQRFVASRIADCVLMAIHNLEPARVGWGLGHEPSQVFNRRWRMKPGTPMSNPFGGADLAVMNPRSGDPNLLEPAGPTDPEIPFISVQAAGGRPIALLANYSLHYVGGVGKGHVSADYFAMFAERIGELLGARGQDPPFVGIMSNGTSGDINNINFRDGSPRRRQPYEKMRMVANMVAAEVFRNWQTVEHRDWVPLGAAQTELEIGLRVPTQAQIEWAQAALKKPKDAPRVHIREEIYGRRVLAMKDYPPRMPLILQALRIGEVGIAAVPNEVLVQMGLEIKKRSPFPHTFTISLANGSYGYLPTVEQHKLGGYETWLGTNRLEIEAAPKMVTALLGLFDGLK